MVVSFKGVIDMNEFLTKLLTLTKYHVVPPHLNDARNLSVPGSRKSAYYQEPLYSYGLHCQVIYYDALA
jgi:hypothetical protein